MRWHAHAGPLSYYSGPWRHREPMRGGWILETDVVSLQPPVLSWAINGQQLVRQDSTRMVSIFLRPTDFIDLFAH